jgi:hypothetical protein
MPLWLITIIKFTPKVRKININISLLMVYCFPDLIGYSS